jgi:hypothetical protein
MARPSQLIWGVTRTNRVSGDHPIRSWEQPGTRLYEYLFLATAPFAVFIVLTFAFESFLEVTLPSRAGMSLDSVYLLLLAIVYGATWICVRNYRKAHPAFLAAPPAFRAGEAVLGLLGWSVLAYIVIGVAVGTLAFLLVDRSDHHWGLIVFGCTVWLPLFFALPVGAVVSWSRVRRQNRTPGNNGMQLTSGAAERASRALH